MASLAPAAAFAVVRADLHNPAHAAAWRAATQAYANDPMGGSQTLSEEVLARNVAGLADWPTAVVFLAFAADGGVAGMATTFRGWGTFSNPHAINLVVVTFDTFRINQQRETLNGSRGHVIDQIVRVYFVPVILVQAPREQERKRRLTVVHLSIDF